MTCAGIFRERRQEVRYGSDAEVRACPLHVCFTPLSGRMRNKRECLRWATSGNPNRLEHVARCASHLVLFLEAPFVRLIRRGACRAPQAFLDCWSRRCRASAGVKWPDIPALELGRLSACKRRISACTRATASTNVQERPGPPADVFFRKFVMVVRVGVCDAAAAWDDSARIHTL